MAANQFDDAMESKKAALVRVRRLSRCNGEDTSPCRIEEGLFLGSIRSANNKEAMKGLNITHVLNVTSFKPLHPDDFVYKSLSVPDKNDADIAQYFSDCSDFIDEGKRKGGILVHCFRGISRSVTVIVAYLMKKHSISLLEALEHVKRQRPVASPNSGFVQQLQDFQKSLQESAE